MNDLIGSSHTPLELVSIIIPFLKIFIYYLIFGCAGSSLLCERSCGEWGLLFVVVHGVLMAVVSLVAEHMFLAHRLQWLQRVGSRAWA